MRLLNNATLEEFFTFRFLNFLSFFHIHVISLDACALSRRTATRIIVRVSGDTDLSSLEARS
jgi:hypothetical protein